MWHPFRACGTALVISLGWCGAAFAQSDNEIALEGEYIIRKSVATLEARAIQRLAMMAGESVAVADETGSSLLVVDRANRRANNQEGGVVEVVDDEHPCEKLWDWYRDEKRLAQRNGGRPPRRVEFDCEGNAIFEISAVPNDSNFSSLWGFNQSNDVDINAPEAWDSGTSCSAQVVAVIDTGVKYDHQDLAQNMWQNARETVNGVDDDGNGIIDDIYGYNAISDSGNPLDDNGHGTHCAGTIGAVGNNGLGVAGVCHNIQIMAIKFLGSNGSGSLWSAVKGIRYVSQMKRRGENIVLSSNSWGGGGFYQSLHDAIAEARDLGILFVSAAGNNANNNDSNPSYPASYDLENIVSVAAVDSLGRLASFSNYGLTSVDIAAPGVGIYSTWSDGGYRSISGTSMATPHISGVLAFIKSRISSITAQQLKDALLRDDMRKTLVSLSGYIRSPGIPNLSALVSDPTRFVPVPPTPVATLPPTPTSTPTATPTATRTPTPTPTPTPGWYDISGQVLDNQNNALVGAAVILHIETGVTLQAVSGPSGEFRFAQTQGPVSYSLSVAKAGYVFNPIQNARLTMNVAHLFQSAPSQVEVSARVIRGDTGQALGGVVVYNGDSRAVTDAQGLARFAVPYGSAYSLRVSVSQSLGFASHTVLSGDVHGAVRRTFTVFP